MTSIPYSERPAPEPDKRPALNVFYVAMTNTFEPFDQKEVRQAIAMGIDRQRLVDNFYPAGSESRPTSPPAPSPMAAWANLGTSSTPKRPPTARRRRLPGWLRHHDLLPRCLPLLPAGAQPVATDLQAQLKETWASTPHRSDGIRRVHRRIERRPPGWHLPARLGRRLPARHQLPRLPLQRFRSRSSVTLPRDL